LSGRQATGNLNDVSGIILETAHPAKFSDIVENVIETKIEIPEILKSCMNKQKLSVKISTNYNDLKDYLLNNN
jgi:threonine synthase